MTPKETLDSIMPNLKECLDAIIKKMPNINMTIYVGCMKVKNEELPYIIEIDLDSIES